MALHPHAAHRVENAGLVNLRAASALTLPQKERIVEVSASVQPPAAQVFQSSQYTEFVLGSRFCDISVLEHTDLVLTVQNNQGVAITLLPVHFLIDRVELTVGDKLIERPKGEHMFWLDAAFLEEEQRDRLQALQGYDDEYRPNLVFNANETRTLVLTLHTVLEQMRPVLCAWPTNADIRLRIYYDFGAKLVSAGPGVITSVLWVSNVLRLRGQRYETAQKMAQEAAHRGKTHSWRVITPRLQTISTTGDLGANLYRLQLGGLIGLPAWMFVTFRTQGDTGRNIVEPIRITDLDIQNSQQRPILGMQNRMPDEYVRKILSTEYFPSSPYWGLDDHTGAAANRGSYLYFFSFVGNPEHAYNTGQDVGHTRWINGQSILAYTPRAAGPTNHQIDVIMWTYAIFTLNGDGSVNMNDVLIDSTSVPDNVEALS